MKKLIIMLSLSAAVVIGVNSSASGIQYASVNADNSTVLQQDTNPSPKKDSSKWNKKKNDPNKQQKRDTL